MVYNLPRLGKAAIDTPHFPTKHQAFIFRAYEYVPAKRIAAVLGTDEENIHKAATDMGLPRADVGDIWLKKGYITIIRSMWHILPYEQLFELLDTDADTLAVLMKEEDFLDEKLSDKPVCEPVRWRELTPEEEAQTAKIKKIVGALDLSGKLPFEFEYDLPNIKFYGKEQFKTRMIYAFSGLYQHAFDVDSRTFLPDEQLLAYKKLGINGIWTQGMLSCLSEFPFDPRVSRGYEERLERVRALTERLDEFGIKLYLYINEPRYMPLSFFEDHPDILGHVNGEYGCLCTSTEKVREYLKNAIESICRAVPLLGGFFTITRSENLTNCYSRTGYYSKTQKKYIECNCPRCKTRSVGEIVSEVIGCIYDGARRVSDNIKVFAWSWAWDGDNTDIIRHLPKGVILISQSEEGMPFEIGGVSGTVRDYSMSIVGPGERAREEWRIAKECGLETAAKVQINTTWEASTVPAIPLTPSIEGQLEELKNEGVRHLLLSWTLGGYPCRNIAAAAKYFYEGYDHEREDLAVRRAEEQFARAFREFPFHINVLYKGPQNAGPSNPLYLTNTGYEATMTCFAYDDLDSWRSIYPEETFEAQFEKLCSGWKKGLDMLPSDCDTETAVMAEAAYCLFKSSLNQIKFIKARNECRYEDALSAATEELKTAEKMLALMNKNAAIGYEAANHYYFSKGQIVEKIVNCHHVIESFEKKL